VRQSLSEKKTGKTENKTGKGTRRKIRAAFLAAAVLATASVGLYFGPAVHAAGPASAQATSAPAASAQQRSAEQSSAAQRGSEQRASEQSSAAPKALPSKPLPKSLSLPLFFEPNQGQTAPQVKFLARGSGYALFLTADEAVLQLQQPRPNPRTATEVPATAPSSVIRMKLDGANSAAGISGAGQLPGKSNYFIGNDPAQWRNNIPQFARVEYTSVYRGVDLVYYGAQGQLEYDFRVAPAADPNQIVLSFQGASAHVVSGASGDAGDSGDLILSTANGDVRFHAPRVYQPATPVSGDASGHAEKAIAGSFRQLAGNKIGFTIGNYDHSRELVIDPVLTYSTYLGGSGAEGLVKVAVDTAGFIYVAGSTTSADFPLNTLYPNNPPFQSCLGEPGVAAGSCTASTAQNIFIAVINPTLVPPQFACGPALNPFCPAQLVYATYLGGSGVDSLAGIAVDSGFSIYVAGTTTSPNFPTNGTLAPFQAGPQTGTHGFLSRISNVNANNSTALIYGLAYSTYLAGNGTDTVTGMAIDSAQNAFVTGVTTSTNPPSAGFPANPNGYQLQSNSPENKQFFASKIYTAGSGSQSMLYSTYFGGAIPAAATAVGGGIAVDPPPASIVNMYITGTTNMLPGNGTTPGFPLFNAYQSCLDQASQTSCNGTNPTNTDAFVAKINPNTVSTASLLYSTYVGGSNNETGTAIAADTSGNAYITGSTGSDDWIGAGAAFQATYCNAVNATGCTDAFIVEIGNLSGSTYPLTYFTYLGGIGNDIGNDIKVDSIGAAHVVGTTTSPNFPTTVNTLQPMLIGTQNTFAASIRTSGVLAGDFSTYLGGSPTDQGTGVAIDVFGATYVAGTTTSAKFPISLTPFDSTLPGSPAAFVTEIGALSQLTITSATTSPSPSPVAAGTQVAFTFDLVNSGPDNASDVNFYAIVPTAGLASSPTAKITSGTGSCGAVSGDTLTCTIPSLVDQGTGTIEVDVTPSITGNYQTSLTPLSVSAQASANNTPVQGTTCLQCSQAVNVVDFSISASPTRQTVNDGDTATIQVTFCPVNKFGYNAAITPSQTTSPSMVTANSPTFNPTNPTLAGSACTTTTLSIATVVRPVTSGSLLRRGSFYAAWLPVGGLSLVGLGIGASRKRRRWLIGAVLGFIAGLILLQPACGSTATSATTSGGTLAGSYTVNLIGSAGTGASHNFSVVVEVN
jgi:hypothetical protein